MRSTGVTLPPAVTLTSDYTPLPAFAASSGPRTAKIAFVGEAWGEDEAKLRQPFIGSSGQELTRMLIDAGILRRECFFTNVLAFRPQDNSVDNLQVGKALCGPDYPLPQMTRGKYLHPKFLPEIERLREELTTVSPNIVVALGATATWALLGTGSITGVRGTAAESSLIPGLKVLPTFHPAFVLRVWANRPIVLADLMKAKRQWDFPEIRRPQRYALVNPTIQEVREFLYAPDGTLRPVPVYSVDIETTHRQISMVGIAVSTTRSCTIPFIRAVHGETNYWSFEEECIAWSIIREVLECPTPKLFQNGMYDLQYLARMGFRPQACIHDTMLLHHSMFPEMQKGLGFMGSVYTEEASWKLMRRRAADEPVKKDE